ncbi:hypothetical protein Acr_05g0003760 [Actinidia rufa]|uniref:Reverse transcriptase zinc-binding domain-containing protein n=1 Tax=Actinidia rufa TaxID=165716 RepID=A0A7J0EMD9_9ERIC|nr:hypothetical protein Acr_05g0003760 [Actinidia rufa]
MKGTRMKWSAKWCEWRSKIWNLQGIWGWDGEKGEKGTGEEDNKGMADGSARGLLCIWDPEIFFLEEACCNRRFILVKVERRDMWLVISNLRSSFPYPWCMGGDFNEIRKIGDRLFSLAQNKEESLREMVDKRIEMGEWVLTFRRRLRAWKEEAADTLKTALIAAKVQTNDENSDHLSWEGCSSKVFTVKSMYHFLAQDLEIKDVVFDLIWKNVAPPRVRCFGWLIYQGRVKTGELLARWGMIQAGDETKLVTAIQCIGLVPMVE